MRLPILGTDAFRQTVSEKYLKEEHKIREIPAHKQIKTIPTIDEIIRYVSQYYGEAESVLKSSQRGHKNYPRNISIYIAKQYSQQSLQTIADGFGELSYTGISKINQRLSQELKTNRELKRDLVKLERLLLTEKN